MNIPIPTIRTPRQRRAIEALLDDEISTFELRKIAGVMNAPQLISDLRKQGWAIECTRIPFQDRDGRCCRPGVYWLSEESKKMAREVLEGLGTAPASTAPSVKPKSKNNVPNGGINEQ